MCRALTHLGSLVIGVLWTTMRTRWGPFTWPTCVSQALQATPPVPCCPSLLWTSVSGCNHVHNVFLIQCKSLWKLSEAVLTIFLPAPTVKPDPPSDVKIKQEEGHETQIKVSWNFPTSWKPQDRYYELIYEVKYQPLGTSFYHEQVGTGWPTDTYLAKQFLNMCAIQTLSTHVFLF